MNTNGTALRAEPLPAAPPRRTCTPLTSTGFTYRDYVRIEERVELIDGVIYLMSSPTGKHQLAVGAIFSQIWTQLEGHPCVPYIAPFDVRLFYDPAAEDVDADTTVVQPDILVVCDPDKRDDAYIKGAPDFIIEVLSPSTSRKDLTEKRRLYERAGVREYWILDPETRMLAVYRLTPEGVYRVKITYAEGTIPIETLGLTIDFFRVFGPPEEATTPSGEVLPPATSES